MKYEHIQVLSDESFRRATGVKKKTFNRMLEIIRQEEVKRKKQGGRPNKLSVEDRLLMTLEYLREYRTFFHISKSYGISESSCYDNIQHIENTLIKDGTFNLPKRKEMLMSDTPIEIVLIDASETPIERPKKKTKNRKNKQKHYYSGKKKRHTLKTQLVVNKHTTQILALNFCNGKKHDFRLLKESNLHINPKTKVLADTGYIGINQIISNASTPHKRSKKHPLTQEQKQENHELSSKRILCENVIGSVKRFRILSERYRNRRKRFGLRFNLIAGIHNFELV